MANRGRWIKLGLLAWLAVGLLAAGGGCSHGDYTVGLTEPLIDLTGHYLSSETVGGLGRLDLALALVEDTNYFKAWLGSDLATGLAPSEAIGSLGDDHLILNFDRGLLSDYYFEGEILRNGQYVQSITGQFVFPDQSETLPVEFLPY